MSKMRNLFVAPLAGALLITAFATGGSAVAAPSSSQTASAQVILVGGGHHHGGYGHGWNNHRPGRWGRLGPRQIRKSLRYQGYRHIRIMKHRGPVYVVKANGWRGARFRLVVDAFNGRILRQKPVGRYYQWGYRW